jgi:hypothetical protein
MNRAAYYGLATAAYGLILLTLAAIEDVLARGLWRPFDIASYYGLAASAVSTINAVVDAYTSPLLVFDAGMLSQYRIFIVGFFCWASAVLVLEMGRRLYGGAAGFVAGLLFALNVAGAQGHVTIAEAMALTLALLSAYTLLFMDGRYVVPGLCAGVAACFKPLVILLLPASLFFIYKRGGPRDLLAFAGAALLPLVLMAAMAFAVYGGNAPTMAADSGFEAAGFVTAEGFRSPDALMAVANIVLSACLLASMLPLALLGFSRKHGLSEEYFLAAGLCLAATVLLRQYLHYWFIALPFLALLCAGALVRRPSHE